MKKSMKLVAIVVVMLGLTVTANKAMAQRVSVSLNLGGARVHYQNYNSREFYGRSGYERPIVYAQRENCGRENYRDNSFRNNSGYNNNYNNNGYNNNGYNNGYNNWNNNGYRGGNGRRH